MSPAFSREAERDAELFALELCDLVRQGLIEVERDDNGETLRFAPSRHGIAAAIADIEAGRV